MELKEILESICGLDEDMDPKAVAAFVINEAAGKEELKEKINLSFYKPEIRMTFTPKVFVTELIFPSADDDDLKALWEALEQYRGYITDYCADDGNYHLFESTFYPLENSGLFLYMRNPFMWSLTAHPDGLGERSIKLCYFPKNVLLQQCEPIEADVLNEEAEMEAEYQMMLQGEYGQN